ncbi:hypothetical protein R3W88_026496 [Solanum pinnatisectum]|uniref:Trichome birefringence-like N-terminal domain-containing protein n=1 Tax=Solanum pinnatisectum TaxID=50273 RepID=A0AAV9LH87_9SOLN|nr:hypothetical protein R3W88_026496 [Solanum pinnatisectum]
MFSVDGNFLLEFFHKGFLPENTLPPAPESGNLTVKVMDPSSRNGKCDLYIGDWVPDTTGPFYTNHTCYSTEAHQNCMRNGRPDTGYLYWRWKPRDCELPKFNPKRFLDMTRHKSLAFIGDSIMRNHVQSLLCILSGTFLASTIRMTQLPPTGLSRSYVWTQQFDNFDYVVIAGGKWYLKTRVYYEYSKIVGCHNCKALNSTLKHITRSQHKTFTFFRTTTPDHFENGEWNTGGYCNRTGPFKKGEIDMRDIDEAMRKIELDEALRISSEVGLTVKLFDTTFLSLLRPDGHPGVYRQFQPFAGGNRHRKVQNDCLHWCWPGPIESWNDFVTSRN